MKRIKQTLIVLAGCFLLFSTASADQTKAAAKASCKCLEPVNAMMKEMKLAMDSGDHAKMMEISRKMESNTEVEACMDKVFEKYESLADDKAKSDKVEAHMRKLCPSPIPNMPGM